MSLPELKLYTDDTEVLRMAERDGCAMMLREARARGANRTAVAVTARRVFMAHTRPGDSGLTCHEVADPAHMPMLLALLAPIIGPIHSMTVQPHDSDPHTADTRH